MAVLSAPLPAIVTPAWFVAHRDEVVVVHVARDTPERSAAADHGAGHLPGAVLLELDAWLAGPPSEAAGRHPLPTPEHFAEGLARAGVRDDDAVVAVDSERGVIAARLAWMLRVTGRDAALLAGAPVGVALEPGPVVRTRSAVEVRPWPAQLLAGPEDAEDPANVVLDARPRERYEGRDHPLDPRPGHVPGARSIPCLETVHDDGSLRSDDELRARFAGAGVDLDVDEVAPVVAYCGSGVTACHTLLVAEHLGLGTGRLYPGSWSQHAHR